MLNSSGSVHAQSTSSTKACCASTTVCGTTPVSIALPHFDVQGRESTRHAQSLYGVYVPASSRSHVHTCLPSVTEYTCVFSGSTSGLARKRNRSWNALSRPSRAAVSGHIGPTSHSWRLGTCRYRSLLAYLDSSVIPHSSRERIKLPRAASREPLPGGIYWKDALNTCYLLRTFLHRERRMASSFIADSTPSQTRHHTTARCPAPNSAIRLMYICHFCTVSCLPSRYGVAGARHIGYATMESWPENATTCS